MVPVAVVVRLAPAGDTRRALAIAVPEQRRAEPAIHAQVHGGHVAAVAAPPGVVPPPSWPRIVPLAPARRVEPGLEAQRSAVPFRTGASGQGHILIRAVEADRRAAGQRAGLAQRGPFT